MNIANSHMGDGTPVHLRQIMRCQQYDSKVDFHKTHKLTVCFLTRLYRVQKFQLVANSKISLQDDEPQGSRDASSASSPRSTVLGIVPEPIEGRNMLIVLSADDSNKLHCTDATFGSLLSVYCTTVQ